MRTVGGSSTTELICLSTVSVVLWEASAAAVYHPRRLSQDGMVRSIQYSES